MNGMQLLEWCHVTDEHIQTAWLGKKLHKSGQIETLDRENG